MIQGSCLCGSVRYRYDGMAETLSMCHCRRCQKAQGTAFVAVVPMATEAFTLMAEAQTLGRYESSPESFGSSAATVAAPCGASATTGLM